MQQIKYMRVPPENVSYITFAQRIFGQNYKVRE